MTASKPTAPLMLWNIGSINLGWFTCVLGAANGYNWLGPAFVAVLVMIHLNLIPARRRELATLAAAAAFSARMPVCTEMPSMRPLISPMRSPKAEMSCMDACSVRAMAQASSA